MKIAVPPTGQATSLRSRLLQGLAAIFSGQVILAAANLLLVPLYLTSWSAPIYGEWLVLFSLVSYLSVLDLGMEMAVGNRLTQAFAIGDLEDYARVQHSALALYLSLAGGAFLLLGVAAWVFPPAWIGLKETPAAVASWVLWLLGLQIILALPMGLIGGIYRTTGNLARSQWLANCRQVTGLGLLALTLLLGGGMVAASLVQLIPLLLIPIYVMWDVKRRFPPLMPGLKRANRQIIREMINPSLHFALFPLANAIILQGPVIIISTVLGGVAVAVFATTRTLVNFIRQIMGSLTNALWPDLTRMEARQEFLRLRVMHRVLVSGSTALCLGAAAALWYEGPEIIAVWTRGKLPPDPLLLRILLLMAVLQIPWLTSATFTAAANHHHKIARLLLASAVLGVTGAAVLVHWWGLWGIPVALLVADALTCAHFVIQDTCVMLGEPYAPFAFRLWGGLVVAAGLSLLAGWVVHSALSQFMIVRWLGVGITTSLVSLAVGWRIFLFPVDRVTVIEQLPFLRGRLGMCRTN